jgi:hypothetical protein
MQLIVVIGVERGIVVTAGVTAPSLLLMLFQHRNSRAVSAT